MFGAGPATVPFAAGDVFVAATHIVDTRRWRGHGRVAHYGADLTLKAELETPHYGIVAGLGLSPDGVLFAFDPEARAVTRFDASGARLPETALAPGVALGSIAFLRDGGFLCGEHLCGTAPPYHGHGNLYRFDRAGRLIRIHRTPTHGGMAGFLGVTHLAVDADERIVTYVSETGNRVMRFDLEDDRALPDLYVRTDEPRMCFGLAPVAGGDVLLAVGHEVRRLSPSGELVRRYALPSGRGWAVVVPARDGTSFWAGEFLAGVLARVDLQTGEIVAQLETGRAHALAGIAEHAPRENGGC